jgi:hypothetical protein
MGEMDAESEQTLASIRAQVEYYLSDFNLKRDRLFYSRIEKAEGGFLPLHLLLKCPKLLQLTESIEEIAQAIATSGELELNSDCTEVRRVHNRPLPPFHLPLKRTLQPPHPTVTVLRLMPSKGTLLSWRAVKAAFSSQFACEEIGYVDDEGYVVLPGDMDESVLGAIISTGIHVGNAVIPVQKVRNGQLLRFWKLHSSHYEASSSQPHQQYKLGGYCFKSSGEVKAYIRSLLATSPDDHPIDPQFHPFLLDLLKLHPKFEGKTRNLAYFAAGKHPTHPESRTFFIVRSDESREDFSTAKCLARV